MRYTAHGMAIGVLLTIVLGVQPNRWWAAIVLALNVASVVRDWTGKRVGVTP